MVEHGATTLWELWQEKTGPSMNSHNHPMFGSIGAWFYEGLAGINFDEQNPGYRRIRIAPQIVRDLNWASGTLDTVRGVVGSSWSRSGANLRMELTVPVGSVAEVHIPKLGLNEVVVEESGRALWKAGKLEPGVAGITSGKESASEIVFEIGSGAYVFERTGN
jgi:alpha-L-rhamnosidase